ncbi:MAG: GNVR domain-containing protein, partial [Bacteroidota bacterium]
EFGFFYHPEERERALNIKFDNRVIDTTGFTFKIERNNQKLNDQPSALKKGDLFAFRINTPEALSREVNGDNLFIKPVDDEIYIVKIYYQHPVPEKATLFVNTLIDEYIDRDRISKSREANKTIDFIDDEIERAKEKLQVSESKLARFRTRTGVVNTTQETDALLKQMSQLDLQMMSFEIQEIELKNLQEYLSDPESFSSFSPDFRTINDELFKKAYQNLKDLELEKTDISSRFPETSTEVLTIIEKMNNLRKFILVSIEKKLLNIKDKKREVAEATEKLRQQFKTFPDRDRQLAVLERDFKIKEQLYMYLTKKRTELAISESSEVTFHKVIDYATIPKGTISPNRPLVLGLSVFLALLLGMIIIYGASIFLSTVYFPEEGIEKLGIPLFAFVNKAKKSEDLFKPFFNLYANLEAKMKSEKVKMISLSSGRRGAGKTFVAVHMGRLLADYGKRVLLIDMDFDRPGLHQYFDTSNSKGLYEMLSEGGTPEAYIQPTPYAGLEILPTGLANGKTTTLIFSPRTEQVLKQLSQQYDLLIIDTPAINKRAEATAIMRISDLNLHIIRRKKSRLISMNQCSKVYKSFQIERLGLVFNGSEQ